MVKFSQKFAAWLHDKALFIWADFQHKSIDEVYQSAAFKFLRMESRKSSGRSTKRPRNK